MFYNCYSLLSFPDLSNWINNYNIENMLIFGFSFSKSFINYFNSSFGKKYKKRIIIEYIIDEKDEKIKLFGSEFVENNKEKCILIINENIYKLSEYINRKEIKIKDKKFRIELIEIFNVNNMSYMFNDCSSLLSIHDISEWNTNNVNDMSYMFGGCSLLEFLPDLSKWNTNNVTNMSFMFFTMYFIKIFTRNF